jgi:hypothetical protein
MLVEMSATDMPLRLVPRAVAASVEELLAGATGRVPFSTTDSKSGASFERVLIDGEPHVVKYLHVDDDWIMRATGDLRCRPLLVWRSGLLDALPASINHAVVGAAEGLGRNGWGAALLMRDVSPWLVPPGDDTVPLEQHLRFMDDMAALAARFWGFTDTVGLTPLVSRWSWFCEGMLAVEEDRGWPDPVPPIVARGWARFAETAPSDVFAVVDALRRDAGPLVTALSATPLTLIHGDWKFGNLGSGPDGRTILLDWAGPGTAPIGCELVWYLAINAARLPQTKEEAIAALRGALERQGIDTDPWWETQLSLCALGAAVLFGWEKALGDASELGWWCDRAREGIARL